MLVRQIIDTQRDVLRRRCDRFAAGGRENVVRRQHDQLGFQLRLVTQRDMDSHLVAVEVGVERRTNQRMQTNRLTFDQNRVEGLNGQTVKRRSTVQQNRMALDHFVQNVPDFLAFLLNPLLRVANRMDIAFLLQAAHDERFEQHKRHLLRKTALVDAKFRTDNDDGTTGIIDTLAEQILAETSLLAFQHVRKGLQRTIASTRDGAAMASVVQQGVNSFLQHAFLVADDDFRRMKLQEVFETIVTIDDTAIQIIQIAGRETTAFQRNQWTQFGGNDRQNAQNHPAWIHVVFKESFDQPHTLGDFLTNRLAGG